MLSDLQIVKDNTGQGTAGIVAKSVRQSFGDDAARAAAIEDGQRNPALEDHGHATNPALANPALEDHEHATNCTALETWLFTTDAGSDETASRRIIRARAAGKPHVLIWECDCLAHQYQ